MNRHHLYKKKEKSFHSIWLMLISGVKSYSKYFYSFEQESSLAHVHLRTCVGYHLYSWLLTPETI